MKRQFFIIKINTDFPLPKGVRFWTCGNCGGGNPLSCAYCQWCGN